MSVQPQPSPLSWRWEQADGAIQITPDQAPRNVRIIRLRIQHATGEFVGHFLPEDLERLADGAREEIRKARTGLVTATQVPRPPGNGTVSPLRRFP